MRKPRASTKVPAVPSEMKAAAIDKFGPPSRITLHTVPVPRPGPREVLIAVEAAGVGIWDAKIRDGEWAKDDVKFPLVLGLDGAGVVVEKGDRVRGLELGDHVWAYAYDPPKGGFCAEYVVMPSDNVAPIPKRLTMVEAGAAAATGLTALQGCDDMLRLRRGETVLIFGASGAVGTLAVQFAARYRGARVIAIASGADAKRLLLKLGAETVIDARNASAIDEIEGAAPDGLDAILALAASRVLTECMHLVKRGGRVAYPNGVEPAPRKRAGMRVKGYDAEASKAAFTRLNRAVDAIPFTVPIAATFPLARTFKAHARQERGHVVGRVVIKV